MDTSTVFLASSPGRSLALDVKSINDTVALWLAVGHLWSAQAATEYS